MKRENRDNSRKCNRYKICGNKTKLRVAAALSLSLHAQKLFKDLTLLLASVGYFPIIRFIISFIIRHGAGVRIIRARVYVGKDGLSY